jgi:carbonic anhydrase
VTDKLLQGFKRFHEETYEGKAALMPRLVAEGQNPDYFIISCIDSRSNPGTIFRPAPGTFLAHKAMGAIVRPYKKGTALAAALQFALVHNNVRQIVVLGHSGCGAIKAMIEKLDDPEIASFMEVAQTALARAKKIVGENAAYTDLFRTTEQQLALQSAENLKTYPSVAKALADGNVTIYTWFFDMDTGNLWAHDEETNKFVQITDHDFTKDKRGHKCATC